VQPVLCDLRRVCAWLRVSDVHDTGLGGGRTQVRDLFFAHSLVARGPRDVLTRCEVGYLPHAA
jgi:hypothetical protein